MRRELGVVVGVVSAFAAALPMLVLALLLAVRRPLVAMYGDQAAVELAVINAGHHTQLVGPYSRFGWHHPGPSWFYLLDSAFLPLGSHGWSLLTAILLLQAVVVALVVIVAWRVADPMAAVLPAALLLAFIGPFGAERLLTPWNPYAVVLPTVLLVTLAGATAAGSIVGLVGLLVVGSFLVQTHVSTAPAVAVVMIGAGVLSLLHHRDARRRIDSLPPFDRPRRRWRNRVELGWGIGLVVLLAAMWTPPALDLVTAAHGNLQAVTQFFLHSHSDHGLRNGVSAVGSQLSVFPFGHEEDNNLAAQLGGGTTARWLVLILFVTAGASLVVLARRLRTDAALGIGVASLLAAAAAVWSVSRVAGSLDAYLVAWVAALPVALCLGYACLLAKVLPAERIWAGLRARRPASIAGAAAGVAFVVGCLALLAARVGDVARLDPQSVTTGESAPIQAAVSAAVRGIPDGAVLVQPALGSAAWPVATGITVRLVQDGRRVVVPDQWTFLWGDQFAGAGTRTVAHLWVVEDADAGAVAAQPGARRVATGSGIQVFLVGGGS